MNYFKLLMSGRYLQDHGRLIIISVFGLVIGIGLVIGGSVTAHSLFVPHYSRIVSQQYSIPFATTTNQDCSLNIGTNQVATNGVIGTGLEKYEWNYVGKKVVSKQKISDVVTRKPVNEIINVGDKPQNAYQQSTTVGAMPLVSSNTCIEQQQLACSFSNLGALESEGNSGHLTTQQYNAYVQLMKDNNCGTPKPFCAFNPSNPCAGTDNSGFEAGYAYGGEYQICDPSYDNGDSQDFNDGVNAWTADNCTDGQPN